MSINLDTKDENKKDIKKEELKMVKGIFRNLENPKSPLSFRLRLESWHIDKLWKFEDGEEIEIPKYVANHLNNNCTYNEYEHAKDEKGNPIMKVKRVINRFNFIYKDL